MIRNFFTRSGIVLLALICIGGALSIGDYLFSAQSATGDTVRKIVETCMRESGDHSACYEREVPTLYPALSVPEIFSVIRAIRQEDASYQFCHVLTHLVGERVVADDPSRWIDAIPLNPPDGLCSNGYIHGVVSGRFGAEVLRDETIEQFMTDFRSACVPHGTWNPSDLDRAMCYHGMGHLFTFITDADLDKAVGVCDSAAPEAYRRVCVQGVFMQIYQPLEPDDYELIERMEVKPTKDTVRQFCAAYRGDSMAEGSCLEESWPLFREEILGGKVAEFCSWQPNAEEADVCYMGASSIIGRMSLGDAEKAVRACEAFPEPRRATCFGYSAQAVLEENRNDGARAVALCRRADEPYTSACLDILVDHARFMFGSNTDMHAAFCATLEDPLRARCARDVGVAR